ncbi:MAG TPA: hypothetical protein VKZ63_15780 [Kofleriaceae bacterium]|nr:hypothetical protein [Kofleriaceae bacterium]
MQRHVISGLVALVLLLLAAAPAGAQPGQTPPGAPPPPTAPPPPGAPAPYGPPPTAPPPAGTWSPPPAQNYALLTPEERELLARGEIGPGVHIAGGLVGTMFGFGLGHAVQGRFGDRGWIFMAGEAGSIAAILIWASTCAEYDGHCEQSTGWLVAGLAGIAVFRVWELIDVWAGPSTHNERVRRARARAYGAPYYGAFVAPTGGDLSGGIAGITVAF